MLPSMPVLFSRESQDALGNKILPSTSFFQQVPVCKPAIISEPISATESDAAKVVQKDSKSKTKKKEEPPKFDNNALETALVRSYYNKVQSQLSNQAASDNKFSQFQNILKSFDPAKETPVDLYRNVELLFGAEHKDLLEDFLLFLKPGQAAQAGRFMDHFMIVQLKEFIQLLHNTFYRKPTVLRKVLRALTTGLDSGSSDDMKARVLPHLRSNPRLIQMFKSLFPDERLPDSAFETGVDTINENFLTGDPGYDVWEFQQDSDNKRKIDNKEALDSMYLHGRVFLQHGRLLRSASVTYPFSKEPYRVHAKRLAPAHSHLNSPESDYDRTSSKCPNKNTSKTPKKTKKLPKSPTKNVKDVNDNTKLKDCIVANNLFSPKAVKSKSQISKKSCKDKKDDLKDSYKRERKDSKSSNNVKKDEPSKAKQAKIEAVVSLDQTDSLEVKNNNWTRDEDKTILQVLKGEADIELVFGRVRELLPHRTAVEIKERFCHVLNLLQEMAVGEVT